MNGKKGKKHKIWGKTNENSKNCKLNNIEKYPVELLHYISLRLNSFYLFIYYIRKIYLKIIKRKQITNAQFNFINFKK